MTRPRYSALGIPATRFVAAFLLNIWFIIVLAVAFRIHHHTHVTQYTWAQTVARSGGTVP
jgi:hypothetical protein